MALELFRNVTRSRAEHASGGSRVGVLRPRTPWALDPATLWQVPVASTERSAIILTCVSSRAAPAAAREIATPASGTSRGWRLVDGRRPT
jgi:hypothetical protein